jgi:hypothetical protein
VCKICATLHDRIRDALKSHDDQLMVKLREIRKIHIDHICQERQEHECTNQKARQNPELNEHLAIDGMTQSVLELPHFAGSAQPKGKYPKPYIESP